MTARDRLMIAGVLLVVALAGFWFFAFAPKRQQAAALQTKIDAANSRLAEAQRGAAAAEQARGRYHADYAEVAKLGKAVPKSDALPSLSYQLQSAAHDARIDFRTLKVNGSGGTGPVAAPATAATAAAAAYGSSYSSSSSSSASSDPAAATQAAAATLPPGATVAPQASRRFRLHVIGSFDMESFMRDVQHRAGNDGAVAVRKPAEHRRLR
jgi:hypothetical protein